VLLAEVVWVTLWQTYTKAHVVALAWTSRFSQLIDWPGHQVRLPLPQHGARCGFSVEKGLKSGSSHEDKRVREGKGGGPEVSPPMSFRPCVLALGGQVGL
jgi:hypothetical protein